MSGVAPTLWATPAGGAIIALAGVILAQLIALLLSSRERKWKLADEKRLRLVERGEELCSLVWGWQKSQDAPFLYYRMAMDGTIDYNNALDAVNESAKGDMVKVERIELIVDVYFPSLRSIWRAAHSAASSAMSVERDFRSRYKNGLPESAVHKSHFEKFMIEAEKKTTELQAAVAKAVRQVAG
jgi:hypothetical protein